MSHLYNEIMSIVILACMNKKIDLICFKQQIIVPDTVISFSNNKYIPLLLLIIIIMIIMINTLSLDHTV